MDVITYTIAIYMYYSHRRESFSCLLLYMFPGSWMVLRIVRGLDIVFELMFNVLSFLDRLTHIYYQLSEMSYIIFISQSCLQD